MFRPGSLACLLLGLPDHANFAHFVFSFHCFVGDEAVLSVEGLGTGVRVGDPEGSGRVVIDYCSQECRTHPGTVEPGICVERVQLLRVICPIEGRA